MYRKRIFFLIIILIQALTSCIKRYEPEIKREDAVKFVVRGQVNKGDKIQHVNISTSSPVSQPLYIPVTGCTVKIIDDKGNTYPAMDMQDGNYDLSIPESALTPGSSFKMDIMVPGGTNIVSDFDQIHECPDVDSVYYKVETLPSNDPSIFTEGIQFYTNLNAENTNSQYFMWELTETYEYHAVYPIEWYYDGTVHHIFPPDKSRFVCWQTSRVNNVFTLSTKNLARNKYEHYPFHFVDNYSSPRLVYGYSLLVRQYAQSEAAFAYWEKIRINSNEQGGLYEKQPLVIKGNLHNLTHPDQEVLGFFSASEVKSKRIFVRNVEYLILKYDPGCGIEGLEVRRGGLVGLHASAEFPIYLYGTKYGYLVILLEPVCYNCLDSGGKNLKPDFWPY